MRKREETQGNARKHEEMRGNDGNGWKHAETFACVAFVVVFVLLVVLVCLCFCWELWACCGLLCFLSTSKVKLETEQNTTPDCMCV